MTVANAGSPTIVDEAGKLTGIFSDGDLRRYMAKDEKILERALKSVMTRNPIVVREEALAAEALRIFNEKNIDDLIVVNDKNEPKGLVDSQDLPKIKMM